MIKCIYEDNHLLVLNKPAGLLTQPTQSGQPNLEDMAKEWIRKKTGKRGGIFLHPIHRLDKVTSGLVLFAKSRKALIRLQKMMKAREIKKTYTARVEGHPPKKSDTLTHTLCRDGQCNRVCKSNHPQGKKAILHYKVIKSLKNHSVLEIQLETGRYHQIRVQLAHIGCPIAGDTKYGSSDPSDIIALCHAKLELIHPVTHECLKLTK